MKIDRDRDEVWDASWNLKSGLWEDGAGRVWRGGKWTPRASAPAAPSAASPDGAVALSVAAVMEEPAAGKKIKDLYRGSGAKVNLYDDNRDGRWDRAKIDLDRDGNWDEKLSRGSKGIERKVGETVFVPDGKGWKKK